MWCWATTATRGSTGRPTPTAAPRASWRYRRESWLDLFSSVLYCTGEYCVLCSTLHKGPLSFASCAVLHWELYCIVVVPPMFPDQPFWTECWMRRLGKSWGFHIRRNRDRPRRTIVLDSECVCFSYCGLFFVCRWARCWGPCTCRGGGRGAHSCWRRGRRGVQPGGVHGMGGDQPAPALIAGPWRTLNIDTAVAGPGFTPPPRPSWMMSSGTPRGWCAQGCTQCCIPFRVARKKDKNE